MAVRRRPPPGAGTGRVPAAGCNRARSRRPDGSPASSAASEGALGAWYVTDRRRGTEASRRGLSRRLRHAFAALGPTYIKLGQIISGGEGLFPPELVAEFKLLRDRVPPEPFDVVRRVVELDLGPIARRRVRALRAHAARGRVDRAGARGTAAYRRRGRRQGAATAGRAARARRHPRDVVARAAVGRAHPGRRARQPARARGAVRRDDRRGARLLSRGARTCSTSRACSPRPSSAPRSCRARTRHSSPRRVLVMERLDGIPWDDVTAMKEAGVDTEAVLHAGLVSFMEGAMLYGVFHGDLHGGNLMVRPDGRTVLMDFGITGRLDETKRLAFLMLLVGATSGDTMGQLRALRDLGAFPPDTDLDGGVHRPRPRPHDRPDAAVGRRARARAAGPDEEAVGVRRPGAQGAHALREEHDVPRRRDRTARTRSRHPRRGPEGAHGDLDASRRAPRQRARHRSGDRRASST